MTPDMRAIAAAATTRELHEPGEPSSPFSLRKRGDAPVLSGSPEMTALIAFRAAAKRLKAAESEFRAAQQAYADAVKQLSDEAVK